MPAIIAKSVLLFPACAGVIPIGTSRLLWLLAFPRVCGGDPAILCDSSFQFCFSPRVRG